MPLAYGRGLPQSADDDWFLVLLSWNSWSEAVRCSRVCVSQINRNCSESLPRLFVSHAPGGCMVGSWLTPSNSGVLEDGICGEGALHSPTVKAPLLL